MARLTKTKGRTSRQAQNAHETSAELLKDINRRFPGLEPATAQILHDAQRAAEDFGHDFIGTEHVLVGIGRSNNQAHDIISKRLGRDHEIRIRTRVLYYIKRATERNQESALLPLTPRTKSVIEVARVLAINNDHALIKPAHILCALLSVNFRNSVASNVLADLGLDLTELITVAAREAGFRSRTVLPLKKTSTQGSEIGRFFERILYPDSDQVITASDLIRKPPRTRKPTSPRNSRKKKRG